MQNAAKQLGSRLESGRQPGGLPQQSSGTAGALVHPRCGRATAGRAGAAAGECGRQRTPLGFTKDGSYFYAPGMSGGTRTPRNSIRSRSPSRTPTLVTRSVRGLELRASAVPGWQVRRVPSARSGGRGPGAGPDARSSSRKPTVRSATVATAAVVSYGRLLWFPDSRSVVVLDRSEQPAEISGRSTSKHPRRGRCSKPADSKSGIPRHCRPMARPCLYDRRDYRFSVRSGGPEEPQIDKEASRYRRRDGTAPARNRPV